MLPCNKQQRILKLVRTPCYSHTLKVSVHMQILRHIFTYGKEVCLKFLLQNQFTFLFILENYRFCIRNDTEIYLIFSLLLECEF